jgi:hypothetical protein
MIIQLLKRTLWYLNISIDKLLKILLKSIQNTSKSILIYVFKYLNSNTLQDCM